MTYIISKVPYEIFLRKKLTHLFDFRFFQQEIYDGHDLAKHILILEINSRLICQFFNQWLVLCHLAARLIKLFIRKKSMNE